MKAFSLNTDVKITGLQYGEEACAPHYAFGPCIRDHWLIHYVQSGRGVFRIHGKNYPVTAGEVFFIPPDISTYYVADAEDPWTYLWLGIYGSGLREVYARAGLTDRTPVRRVDKAVCRWMESLLEEGEAGTPYRAVADAYMFLEALVADGPETVAGDAQYVKRAEDYVRQQLYSKVTVADVAQYVNVDRSYLTALFKKHRNQSTQQFILQVKMEAAKRYLMTTDYDVARIARSVGYDDPFVFSHAFKKECGLSPSDFRKRRYKGI